MKAALIMLTLLAAGCTTVGPAYERPDIGLQDNDNFVYQQAPASVPTKADLRWWEQFDDPQLTLWVERALAGNLDIAVAFERIDQAAAALQGAQGRLQPTLDASTQVTANYRRGNTNINNRSTQNNSNSPSASAGLQFDWALDLWGGL